MTSEEPARDNATVYQYRPDVLEALARHGVRPLTTSNPEMVRGFVRELYKFEIRKLRARVISGEIVKSTYAGHIDALRRTYPVLSLQSWQFLVDGKPPLDSLG